MEVDWGGRAIAQCTTARKKKYIRFYCRQESKTATYVVFLACLCLFHHACPSPYPIEEALPNTSLFLSLKASLCGFRRENPSYNSSIVSYRLQCRLAFQATVGNDLFPFRAWLVRLIIIVQVPVLYSGAGFVHGYLPLWQMYGERWGPMTLQARVGAARQKC
jgi:hypothetical protein